MQSVRLELMSVDEVVEIPVTLYNINGQSSTGGWWPKMSKKNGEFPAGTIPMNSEKIIQEMLALDTYDEMVKFMMRNLWMVSPIVKPKKETIELKNIFLKVRLYESYAAVMTALPQLFTYLFESTRYSNRKPRQPNNNSNIIFFTRETFNKMSVFEK